MNSWLIGMAAVSALLAVIPSKREAEKEIPGASIALAITAGFLLALGLQF